MITVAPKGRILAITGGIHSGVGHVENIDDMAVIMRRRMALNVTAALKIALGVLWMPASAATSNTNPHNE